MAEPGWEQLCEQAKQAVAKGDYRRAKGLYQRAVEQAPKAADAHFGLATCCFMLEHFDAALKHFQEASHLDPKRATCYINMGAIYSRLGQPDKALQCLRTAVGIDSRRAEAYYNLGLAYRSLGQLDLAAESYREATRLNPRMAEAFLNLGNVLLASERYDEAASAYQQALAVKPDFQKAARGLESVRRAMSSRRAQAPGPAGPQLQPPPAQPSPAATPAEPVPGFANETERVLAIEDLRQALERHQQCCTRMAQMVEQELVPALRNLGHALVGRPAYGELKLHAEAYSVELQKLLAARDEMAANMERILALKARFAAQLAKP